MCSAIVPLDMVVFFNMWHVSCVGGNPICWLSSMAIYLLIEIGTHCGFAFFIANPYNPFEYIYRGLFV